MQIYSIKNLGYSKQPSFGIFRRCVYNEAVSDVVSKTIKHRNDTWFFRSAPNWKELVRYLEKKYKDVKKVNVYDYACSTGAEAYTFLMAMITYFGKDIADKYSPVIAKDYDEYIINKAKDSQFDLSLKERIAINKNTMGNLSSFFEVHDGIWIPREDLSKRVNYSEANVLEDFNTIEPNNSVVFIRNVWPYFTLEQQEYLARGLYERLGNSSMLVIGDYDLSDSLAPCDSKIVKLMEKIGFKTSADCCMFEKE